MAKQTHACKIDSRPSNPTRRVRQCAWSAATPTRPPGLLLRRAPQYGADRSRTRSRRLWRRPVGGVGATIDDGPRHPDPWVPCGGRRRCCCCNRSRLTTRSLMSRPGCGCCWCPGTPGSAAPFTDSGPPTPTTTIHWNSTSKVKFCFVAFLLYLAIYLFCFELIFSLK